jgi:hypothetical protein
MHGIIKTVGTKAITIEDECKKQYYAPFGELHENIFKLIPLIDFSTIHVHFNVDFTMYSYETPFGKRFYARNVDISSVKENYVVL